MFQFKIRKVVYSLNRGQASIVDESIDGSTVVSTAEWRKTDADNRCSEGPFTKVYLRSEKHGKSHVVVAETEESFWGRLSAAKKAAEATRS